MAWLTKVLWLSELVEITAGLSEPQPVARNLRVKKGFPPMVTELQACAIGPTN
jgi:hypothetical protein